MRKISKCLSIVLVFLLTLIIMAPMKMQASAHFEESSDHTFIDIETNQKFTNIKKSPRNMKSVYTTLTNDDAEHISDIKELAENGVDVFVECEAPDEIEENFGFDFRNTLNETNGIMLGFVLENNAQGIRGTPVYACCMYEENEQPSTLDIMTDCINIKNEFSITQDDINSIKEKQSNCDINDKIKSNAMLQSMSLEEVTSTKNVFYNGSWFVYAYGKKLNGKTDWSKTDIDGYVRLGYAKLTLTCYSLGDLLNRNYDSAIVLSEVGAYGNYSVEEYTTGLAVLDTAEIFSPKKPNNTSNKRTSVSSGVGISSNGVVTNTITHGSEISPDGQTFSGLYLDEFIYQITATPESQQKGSGWESISSITAAIPKGELGGFVAAIMGMKISYWRTYTLVDGEAGQACLYKSHKSI